jgi:hypothetical protein
MESGIPLLVDDVKLFTDIFEDMWKKARGDETEL